MTTMHLDNTLRKWKENKKMITERTLRKWRKEVLEEIVILASSGDKRRLEIRQRVLRLTQELLDQHLLRK